MKASAVSTITKSLPIALSVLVNSSLLATLGYINLFSQKKEDKSALNALNEALLNALQKGGAVFLSNALVKENYCLRACIVNFRTSARDIAEIIQIVVQEGRNIHIK